MPDDTIIYLAQLLHCDTSEVFEKVEVLRKFRADYRVIVKDQARELKQANETIEDLRQQVNQATNKTIEELRQQIDQMCLHPTTHPAMKQHRLSRVRAIAPETGPFRDAVNAAFRRGKTWTLTEAEWREASTQPCCYCSGPTGNGIGLDRLDNGRGYEPGNIVPCCGPCNIKKGQK